MRRFLWAQAANPTSLTSGSYLADRYRVLTFPLLEDTQPEVPPPPLEVVPPLAAPYLALSTFALAVPRPFTQVMHPDDQMPLLLLEEVPLAVTPKSPDQPLLLPIWRDLWPQASGLRQLCWLWRCARLWQPCVEQQVAHCLLDDQTVRADGEHIRLLSLWQQQPAPTLADLGDSWQSLVSAAAAEIRDYLSRLTQHLASGQGTSRWLVHSLEQAMEQQTTQQTLTVQVATQSDRGPTRQRNEDACLPPSGYSQTLQLPPEASLQPSSVPLVVVCDGVGGHQGGDVASQSAIAVVTQQLPSCLNPHPTRHQDVVTALKQVITAANQVIVERNDADHRQDRDRMGTTIVMALVYGGQLYVAHLGDSRAYQVRSQSCRQLTLDDDIAAREMRLGLELYQDALQNPGAGALVQALGMASQMHLHPTVQVFPIVDHSVILLCSDGLSDHDLVERSWSLELLPALRGDLDIPTTAKRLVDLANAQNGHDNVTVGLLRLSPQRVAAPMAVPVRLADLNPANLPPTQSQETFLAAPVAVSSAATAPVPTVPPRARFSLLPVVVLLGLLGIASALGWQWWRGQAASELPAAVPDGEILSPSATPPGAAGTSLNDLTVGDYFQIQQVPDPSTVATIVTTVSPPALDQPAAVDSPERLLTIGSVVKVSSRQRTPDDQLWVRLQVCSTPAPAALADRPDDIDDAVAAVPRSRPVALPGDQGWILQTDLPIFAVELLDTSPTQQGLCTD